MRLGGIFDYDAKVERLEEVTREMEQPDVWDDPQKAQALGKERASLEQVVETLDKLQQGLDDVEGLVDLAVEAEDEDTFNEAQRFCRWVDDQNSGHITRGAVQPPVGPRTDSMILVASCAHPFNDGVIWRQSVGVHQRVTLHTVWSL